MKCKFCESEGQVSKVYPMGSTMTAMYCQPYYDEEGAYHHHNSNVYTERFGCSRGHEFTVRSNPKCPNCDFGGEIETILKTQQNETH